MITTRQYVHSLPIPISVAGARRFVSLCCSPRRRPCPCRPPLPRIGVVHALWPTTHVAPAARRLFSVSRHSLQQHHQQHSDGQTHYETLNVPPHASTAEIKRSFYGLSKMHHPDHNPDDPSAPRRFMRISEAYAVLGHSGKRAAYDRDVMAAHRAQHQHQQHQQQQRHHGRPNASYHSTGPAGGRPASGLSRRRGSFRGPPPSFFRNRGDGQGTASSAGAGEGPSQQQQGSAHTSGTASGPNAKPNHDGWASARANPEAPHFDRASNERTHRRMDERVADRRAAAAAAAAGTGFADESMMLGFVVICAAVAAGVMLPGFLFGSSRKQPAKNRKQRTTESSP